MYYGTASKYTQWSTLLVNLPALPFKQCIGLFALQGDATQCNAHNTSQGTTLYPSPSKHCTKPTCTGQQCFVGWFLTDYTIHSVSIKYVATSMKYVAKLPPLHSKQSIEHFSPEFAWVQLCSRYVSSWEAMTALEIKDIVHWTVLHQLHHVAMLLEPSSRHSSFAVKSRNTSLVQFSWEAMTAFEEEKTYILHWTVVHQLPLLPGYQCFHPNTTVCGQAQLLHISSWEAMTSRLSKNRSSSFTATTQQTNNPHTVQPMQDSIFMLSYLLRTVSLLYGTVCV